MNNTLVREENASTWGAVVRWFIAVGFVVVLVATMGSLWGGEYWMIMRYGFNWTSMGVMLLLSAFTLAAGSLMTHVALDNYRTEIELIPYDGKSPVEDRLTAIIFFWVLPFMTGYIFFLHVAGLI